MCASLENEALLCPWWIKWPRPSLSLSISKKYHWAELPPTHSRVRRAEMLSLHFALKLLYKQGLPTSDYLRELKVLREKRRINCTLLSPRRYELKTKPSTSGRNINFNNTFFPRAARLRKISFGGGGARGLTLAPLKYSKMMWRLIPGVMGMGGGTKGLFQGKRTKGVKKEGALPNHGFFSFLEQDLLRKVPADRERRELKENHEGKGGKHE